MNKSLLLYFGKLREFLFEMIEQLLCNNTPETQRLFVFNKSENSMMGEILKRVNESFIKSLAQKMLFHVSNDLPRFSLIDPFISALNKDIFKRLKLYLKKKYSKTSLSDFLKQKLKHFVVNLFLTFFFETLTSQEEFNNNESNVLVVLIGRQQVEHQTVQHQVPTHHLNLFPENVEQKCVREQLHLRHWTREDVQPNLRPPHCHQLQTLQSHSGLFAPELSAFLPQQKLESVSVTRSITIITLLKITKILISIYFHDSQFIEHFRKFQGKYSSKLLTNLFVYQGLSPENREVNPFLNPGMAVLLYSIHELITDEMLNQAIMNPDVKVSLSLQSNFFRERPVSDQTPLLNFDIENLKTCTLCGIVLPIYFLNNVEQVD
jgi:hypothetical protein